MSDDCLVTISVPGNLFFILHPCTSLFTLHCPMHPLLCFSMISCSHFLAEAVSTGFVPGWCVMGTALGWALFGLSSAECCATSLPSDQPGFSSSTEHVKGHAYESITSLAHSWLWEAAELCGRLQFQPSLTDLRNAKSCLWSLWRSPLSHLEL